MAIIGNGVRLSGSNPMRQSGAVNLGTQTRERERTPGSVRNIYSGPAVTAGSSKFASVPAGARPPVAWILAPKSGGIASRYSAIGSSAALAALVGGYPIIGTSIGGSTASGTGSLLAAGIGTSSSSSAAMGTLVGTILGVGSSSGSSDASATLTGLASMIAASTSSSTLATGTLAALIMAGASSSASSATGTATATGSMIGSSGGATALSPSALAAAVWGALAAANITPGTMGEKLNDAGGAADPWDDARALTVAKFLGLK